MTILSEKDCQLETLRKNMEVATKNSESVRDELERLRQCVMDLEATKEKLMEDHERLAAQRSRSHRASSAEFPSARTSGATLINERSSPSRLTGASDDPPPVPFAPILGSPVLGTVQDRDTNRRHVGKRSDTQRHSLTSATPPVELRQARRKSGFGLRDMVMRIVKKDSSVDGVIRSPTTSESQWGNKSTSTVNNIAPKPVIAPPRQRPISLQSQPPSVPRPIPRPTSGPQNLAARPRTSTAPTASIPRHFPGRKELDAQHLQRPRTATTSDVETRTAPVPRAARPPNARRSSQPRYYTSPTAIAIDSSEDLRLPDARPKTATAPLTGIAKGHDKRAKHDSGLGAVPEGEKSKLSRLSWGNTAQVLHWN